LIAEQTIKLLQSSVWVRGTQANYALRLPLSRKTYFAKRAQDGDLDQALKLLGRAGGMPPAAGDAAV